MQIETTEEYQQALALLDELFNDYENNKAQIECLAKAVEDWENTAEEFSQFNKSIAELDGRG